MVSKLSGTTKSLTTGILQDPGKMESMISMVRTFAPLTSAQTVSRVNTYLPAVEKVSTLLGMYSFLNRAQNFRPILALNAKTPVDKITALLKSGNIPVSKLMAQPLLANNMDKIMSAIAVNMAKNGSLNEMLSSLTNGNKNSFNEMLTSLAGGNKDGNTDINSLMETFMPMINNIMSSSDKSEKSEEPDVHSDNHVFKNAQFDYSKEDNESDNKPVNTPPSEKNIKHEKHVQRPIHIRQRRRQ